MNKKGFTLVELLATIVLLCLITLIATFTINKTVNDAKKRSHNSQVDTILSGAIAYSNKEEVIDLTNIDGYKIYLKDMASKGYIEDSIKDPLTGDFYDMNSSYVEIIDGSSSGVQLADDVKDFKYNGNYIYTLHAVYE